MLSVIIVAGEGNRENLKFKVQDKAEIQVTYT